MLPPSAAKTAVPGFVSPYLLPQIRIQPSFPSKSSPSARFILPVTSQSVNASEPFPSINTPAPASARSTAPLTEISAAQRTAGLPAPFVTKLPPSARIVPPLPRMAADARPCVSTSRFTAVTAAASAAWIPPESSPAVRIVESAIATAVPSP